MRWIVGVGVLVMACGGPAPSTGDAAAIDAVLVDATGADGTSDANVPDAAPSDGPAADAAADAARPDAARPDDAPFDAGDDAAVDATPDAVTDATLDAMPDATGACSSDSDCADPHAVCDLDASPHACVCAAGYALDLAGDCQWSGVIENPGFTMPGAWTTAGGTVIDPALDNVGMVDLGAGLFDGDIKAPCPTENMTLAQPIEMPRRSRAEPLVLAANYSIYSWDPNRGLQFGIGTTWHAVTAAMVFDHGWYLTRQCLGAAEYAPESTTGRGAPFAFAILLDAPALCLAESHLKVDRVEIVPAAPGECP
ncbi:MAG: hypothetical protein K8W52_07520 [Deltaproteobacteria bacterium]|nr:hypothetical protein [Deltaproteobacteria bacterium]